METDEATEAEIPKSDSAIFYKNEPKIRPPGPKRVHVMPGLTSNFKSNYDEPVKYISYVPTLPEAIGDEYIPMTYVFRVPQFNICGKVKNLRAPLPPFHVLLDHTLAVIWCLISSQPYKTPCGVNQLQWAYNFLKIIRKPDGRHSEDIRTCLKLMEKALLMLYQNIESEDLEKIANMNQRIVDEKLCPNFIDLPFSMTYNDLTESGKTFLTVQKKNKKPQLTEQELKDKIKTVIERLSDLDTLSQIERKELFSEFLYYKTEMEALCFGHMQVLTTIHDVLVSRMVETPVNACDI